MNIRQSYNYRIDRQAKARRKRNKRIVLVLLLVLVAVGYLVGTKSSQRNRAISTPQETVEVAKPADKIIDSPLADILLPIDGQSAVGTLSQGLILKSENEQQAPIASITKVITALIILEKRPLTLGDQGDTITLNQQDEQYYHDYYALLGTLTPVTAGLTMTQYEALQAMLLPSSNNMADSMVDRYFSSREEYLTFANNYLRDNGLFNTSVADASGFSPDSKSTPSDLIRLGQLALQNPVIKQIVVMQNATISVAGDIPNYNPLIEEPNVIGIKPGATDEAGFTLLFAAEFTANDGTKSTMIAATMNHFDRNVYVQSALSILDQSRTILTK